MERGCDILESGRNGKEVVKVEFFQGHRSLEDVARGEGWFSFSWLFFVFVFSFLGIYRWANGDR